MPRGRTSTIQQGAKRALAVSALCLAAAWKQPRGVFTVTTPRYDDGRRQLRMPLEELFREAVERCNAAVIPGVARSRRGDVFHAQPAQHRDRLPRPALRAARATTPVTSSATTSSSKAWRRTGAARTSCGRPARASCASGTRPSAPSGRLVRPGPRCSTFRPRARRSSCPTAPTPMSTPRNWGVPRAPSALSVRRIELPHRYAFGTHAAAERRSATEYVFVARSPGLYSGRCRRW